MSTDPRSIKAIDTHYNGYKFRSRLEARWAVFFDQMDVRYQYEPEGFDLGGTRYLPDFRLTDGLLLYGEEEARQNVWIEIKPTLEVADEERDKVAAFARGTGYQILLIGGDPGPDVDMRLVYGDDELRALRVKFIEFGDGRLGAVHVPRLQAEHDPDTATRILSLAETDRLQRAYALARSERFQGIQRTCTSCGKPFFAERDYYHLCPRCYRQQQAAQPTKSRQSGPWIASSRSGAARRRSGRSRRSRRATLPFTLSRPAYYALSFVILLLMTAFLCYMLQQPLIRPPSLIMPTAFLS